jgi:hypothetical protein
MKKRNGYLLAAVISVALFSYVPTSADDDCALVAGITEGPDPIPHVVWAPIDTFFPSIDLGPGRSDGRPDITEDSEGNPVITWIRRQGIARNVALLRWDGSAWLPVEFVTSGITERKDPRSQSKSADYFHVVWWVSGAIDRVYHTQGRPGAFGPARIVAEDARRPSVLQVGMSVYVAYERTTFSGTQEVVVAVRSPGDAYLATPLFAVQRVGPLDIVIHEDGGRIWMDWKSSDTQMSYSTLADGVWSAPEFVSWNDPSWAGSEATRAKIREIVLAP